MPRFFRILTLLVFIIFLIPLGCQTDRTAKNPTGPSTPRKISYRTDEQMNQRKPAVPNAQKTSHRLVKLATGIPGVKNATAVVFGKYTLVGIDVDPSLDRSRVGTIKYSVAQALKKDPQGVNALVTADPDLNHRLRRIHQQIMKGKPLSGITDELADIAGRIAPQPSKNVR